MKGKEIITHAVRIEMPDMERLRENSIRLAKEKEAKTHSGWAQRLVPVAACLAVVLAVVIAFPYVAHKGIAVPGTDTSGTGHTLVELPLRGLPVENFSLANVQADAATMDRIAYWDFGAIFERGVDCFVVVKVDGVDSEKLNESDSFRTQISHAVVLQEVYGGEDFAEPSHIQIRQAIIQNHFCLGTTNLLRKDGVYLLPLKQEGDTWYILGDMDVLFEVDDTGKVWSHSDFEDFKRHDGKNIESFIEDLQNLFADEEFRLAHSPLAGVLRGWTLADHTITATIIDGTDRYGQPYFVYAFSVNEIFSEPNHASSTPLGKTGSLTVHVDPAHPIVLMEGNRYLVGLDRYEGGINVNAGLIVEIGMDGTITAIPAPDHLSTAGQAFLQRTTATRFQTSGKWYRA